MPRMVLFVDGELGARALEFLSDDIVGVVLPPPDRRAARLRDAVKSNVPIFDAGQLEDPETVKALHDLKPTHGLSVLFGYLLKPDIIEIFPHGIANLHPSMLPQGRGSHPDAWAIASRQPAGVTLHLIDEGLNTGPILLQEEVMKLDSDTAATLYARLMDTATQFLASAIERWIQGQLKPVPQDSTLEPSRSVSDLDQLLRIDPERAYTGRELVNILRARTFAPYPGAPYEIDGRRLRLRIEIEEEPR